MVGFDSRIVRGLMVGFDSRIVRGLMVGFDSRIVRGLIVGFDSRIVRGLVVQGSGVASSELSLRPRHRYRHMRESSIEYAFVMHELGCRDLLPFPFPE